jgi:hypothetical protein
MVEWLIIGITMMVCFIVLSYGMILIRQDIDELKELINKKL